MKFRSVCVAASTVALAVGLAACGGDDGGGDGTSVAKDCKPRHEVSTIDDGVLTVSAVEFPPVFVSGDDGGNGNGLEGELIKKIADRECLDVEFQVVSGEGVVPAVQSGRADVAVGGWYRSADRNKVVGLSAPLYNDHIGIVSEDGATGLDELDGAVGTATGNVFIPEVKEVLGDRLRLYPGFPDLYNDLKAGRIKNAIVLYNEANARLKENPMPGLEVKQMAADDRVSMSQQPAQIGLPYTKDNADLGKALDAGIAELREDGTLERLLTEAGYPASSAEVGEPTLLGS